LAQHIPAADAEVLDWEGLPKFAVVGRRNVGKSSFVNVLARTERCIVSDRPGTTRDSVDLLMEKDGRRFCPLGKISRPTGLRNGRHSRLRGTGADESRSSGLPLPGQARLCL